MKRISLLLMLAALPAPVLAGPPTVCWPIAIGSRKPPSIEKLDAKTPVLVRMESIRLAALKTTEDRFARERLVAVLLERVVRSELRDEPDALAWFDAGYALACYRELNVRTGADGYPYVRRAIKLRQGDASMEFACALMTLMGDNPMHKHYHGHVARARAGAKPGSMLAKNLEAHAKQAPAVLDYFEKVNKRVKEK